MATDRHYCQFHIAQAGTYNLGQHRTADQRAACVANLLAVGQAHRPMRPCCVEVMPRLSTGLGQAAAKLDGWLIMIFKSIRVMSVLSFKYRFKVGYRAT